MAYSELIKKTVDVVPGNDSIIFQEVLTDIPGGRTLDVTGWKTNTIPAGTVIIRSNAGEYSPLGLNEDGDAYVTVPSGSTAVGLLKTTTETSDAQAAIVTSGSVNEPALPFTLTSALKTALKGIILINQ